MVRMWDFVKPLAIWFYCALYLRLTRVSVMATVTVAALSFLANSIWGFISRFAIFQRAALNVGLIELVSHNQNKLNKHVVDCLYVVTRPLLGVVHSDS